MLTGPVKVLVVDYDGTLTTDDHLADHVRQQLHDARSQLGLTIVLATGRRWVDLVRVLPDVRDLFDAVVAEDGAVLDAPDGHRLLCEPVGERLVTALARAGVPLVQGDVLVECPPGWDEVVFAAAGRVGADEQVVRNRGQIMVLPAGVSKGTGVIRALAELGLSRHNAVGLGDAENDHSMLDVCEWSATPATAVPSLRHRADVVLSAGPGDAVAELLREHVVPDRLASRRRKIFVGHDEQGTPISLPAAARHLLVTGGTRAGKSFFTGALIEQLIDDDHSVLAIDPEGDYSRLTAPLGPIVIAPDDATDDLPRRVEEILAHRFGSVVLDLSRMPLPRQRGVVGTALHIADSVQAVCGAPHWIVIDEAHLLMSDSRAARVTMGSRSLGSCLVTYRPQDLSGEVLDQIDAAVVIPGPSFDDDDAIRAVAAVGSLASDRLTSALDRCGTGQGVLVDRRNGSCTVIRTLTAPHSTHVRHREKYIAAPLPPRLHFLFRNHGGDTSGPVAADVDQFCKILRHCPPEAVRHHASGHDFSAWFGAALQDPWSATEIHDAEDRLRPKLAGAERVRAAVLAVVEHRYLR